MRYARYLAKLRFYSSVTVTYGLTLLFVFFAAQPLFKGSAAGSTAILARSIQKPFQPPANSRISVISGLPVRIVIPASGIDLPVDEGYYDSADGSWTLSGYRAQFAMMSTLANNVAGDTFIYGHNNDYVFGALRHVTPSAGAEALLYTDNGHVFEYSFASSFSLAPDDTSVLTYSGPPAMTIQTCTGSVNEWRTMYRFNFVKVLQ